MLVQDDVVLFVVQLLGGGQNEVQLIVHEVRKERDLSEKFHTNHSSRAFVSNRVHGPIEHVKHPLPVRSMSCDAGFGGAQHIC